MLVEDVSIQPDRGRCPVCGDPTGDCAPADQAEHVKILPYADPSRDANATFVVDQQVFQELRAGKRQTFVRLYRVGQRITPEEAERVGLLADDRPERLVVPVSEADGHYRHQRR